MKIINDLKMLTLVGMIFFVAVSMIGVTMPCAAGPEGQPAPEFALPGLDGKSVSLSSLDDKVVLLTFWATWCGACREEVPILKEIYSEYKDKGVVILAVSLDVNREDRVKSFVKENDIQYPVLFGTMDVAQRYGIRGIPVTWMLGKKLTLKKRYLGVHSYRAFQEDINALLKNPAS